MRKDYNTGYFLPLIVLFMLFVFVPCRIKSDDNNLLTNSDFEDRELNGWEKEIWNEGGKIESTDAKCHNGKYAIKISSGAIENDVRLTQEVLVNPDSYYKLSGWIATENVQEGKVGANICLVTGFNYTGDVTGTKDWMYYELKFKTSKSHYLLKVGARLGMYYNTVKGTAFFDDIRLEKLDYTPRYYITLKEPEGVLKESEDAEQVKKDRGRDNRTRDNQGKNIKKRDPVFSQINLPLVLLLISIGLVPIIINMIFTIRREKKNGHTQENI
jgi:hypothetical protein